MANEENVLKRIAPHSEEAESAVIGSMLIDNDAISIASELLTGEDFYNKVYGVLFDTMVEIGDSGASIDPVVLQDKLREKNVAPQYNSIQYIQSLINATPTSANVKSYAVIVSEKSILRRLIKETEGISGRCFKDEEDIEVILNDTEKSIFNIVQNRNTSDITPIKKVVTNALEKIEAAYYNKGVVTGIATGFTDLDYKTAGMQPSDLILLAARP